LTKRYFLLIVGLESWIFMNARKAWLILKISFWRAIIKNFSLQKNCFLIWSYYKINFWLLFFY
jgi:hypothetical protein